MDASRGRAWIVGAIVAAVTAPVPAEEPSVPREALLLLARQRFVRVVYHLKPSEEPEDAGEGLADFYRRMQGINYQYYLDEKMPLELAGVLLDAAGTVLIGDYVFRPEYVERIEVTLPDGRSVPAKRYKLLDRAPAELLKLAEPVAAGELAFAPAPEITADTTLYGVLLARHEQEWLVSWSSFRPAFDYAAKTAQPLYLLAGGAEGSAAGLLGTLMGGPAGFLRAAGEAVLNSRWPILLADEKGRCVGVVVGPGLDARQVDEDWHGQALLTGPGLTAAELDALKDRCKQQWGARLFRCLVQFRTKARSSPRDPWSAMLEMREVFTGTEDAGSEKEWSVVGLAIGPRRLFVPRSIARKRAARIESILVTIGQDKKPARFVGAFKDFGGFLLELTEGQLPAFWQPADRPVPRRNQVLLTVEAEPKLGGVKLTIRHNRWISRRRGYEGRYYEQLMEPVKPGTLVLTPDLKLVGMVMRQRKEGEELRMYQRMASASSAFMTMASGADYTLFWTRGFASALTEPVAHFDKRIRQMTKDEQERRAWLGVEFTRLSADLAKQLKVEKPTRDGKIGLLVNHVYDGSPAQKLGLKVGDILLKLKVPNRPAPIELSAAEAGFGGFDFSGFEMPEEYEAMGFEFPRPAPWKSRGNYLTKLLDAVGEGERVELTYLSGGQEVTKPFIVERAPRDFDSATKYKNEQVGLTVKDVTYEVRAALKLPDDKQAVIVAKVEPGSPAAVAKIRPFELITQIDGKPVGGADAFKRLLEEAAKAKKTTVRITIERLGRSRFADLEIGKQD